MNNYIIVISNAWLYVTDPFQHFYPINHIIHDYNISNADDIRITYGKLDGRRYNRITMTS